MSKPAYLWRKLTSKQREQLMAWRKNQGLPWHRPPHRAGEHTRYHVTAACYEHRPWIGLSPDRMAAFSLMLLEQVKAVPSRIHAWCVLPNHYHLLIESVEILGLLNALGKLHGKTSFQWNGEEQQRGRQVWCGAAERYMRTDAHFWATLNYVLHNPVHHGYVERWQDWPFSSAQEYLTEMGRGFAEQTWKSYPILDYGKGWDEAEL